MAHKTRAEQMQRGARKQQQRPSYSQRHKETKPKQGVTRVTFRGDYDDNDR